MDRARSFFFGEHSSNATNIEDVEGWVRPELQSLQCHEGSEIPV